jgi:hypothetical protein
LLSSLCLHSYSICHLVVATSGLRESAISVADNELKIKSQVAMHGKGPSRHRGNQATPSMDQGRKIGL